jgi:iron-sulfur cluster assembly protein
MTATSRGGFIVLTLTPTAAEAVRQLSGGSGLEPDPGLRISPGEPTAQGTPLQLDLTGGPQSDDQTVEQDGATVYVEADVAEFLDDKVLDATIASGGVRFTLADVGDADAPPQE